MVPKIFKSNTSDSMNPDDESMIVVVEEEHQEEIVVCERQRSHHKRLASRKVRRNFKGTSNYLI